MSRSRGFRPFSIILLTLVLILAPGSAAGSSSKVLYEFKGGNDGGHPAGALILDATGNLYGTTRAGGINTMGAVFKLAHKQDGSWKESVLYRFTGGSDGQEPWGGLIFDGAGNLYGTTRFGGQCPDFNGSCGTVFKLTSSSDGSWMKTVLYTFCHLTNCADGLQPYAGLTLDETGNLYGTTVAGGALGDGTVFKLTPNSDGTWTESVLHSFGGPNGGAGLYRGSFSMRLVTFTEPPMVAAKPAGMGLAVAWSSGRCQTRMEAGRNKCCTPLRAERTEEGRTTASSLTRTGIFMVRPRE